MFLSCLLKILSCFLWKIDTICGNNYEKYEPNNGSEANVHKILNLRNSWEKVNSIESF